MVTTPLCHGRLGHGKALGMTGGCYLGLTLSDIKFARE